MDPDTGEDGAASDEGVGGRGEEGKRWITQSVVGVGVSRNYQRTRHERSSGVIEEKRWRIERCCSLCVLRRVALCARGQRRLTRDAGNAVVRYLSRGPRKREKVGKRAKGENLSG